MSGRGTSFVVPFQKFGQRNSYQFVVRRGCGLALASRFERRQLLRTEPDSDIRGPRSRLSPLHPTSGRIAGSFAA
jgi:hypothetical protein